MLGTHDLERDLLLLCEVNAAVDHGRPAPINLLQDPRKRASASERSGACDSTEANVEFILVPPIPDDFVLQAHDACYLLH